MTKRERSFIILLVALLAALGLPLFLWSAARLIPALYSGAINYTNICAYSTVVDIVCLLFFPAPSNRKSVWIYLLIGLVIAVAAVLPLLLSPIPDEETSGSLDISAQIILFCAMATGVLFWGLTLPFRRPHPSDPV